ncbi:holin [Alkalihalobacillus sp. FSL W8-0930]
MEEVLLFASVLAPVVLALIQVLKKAVNIKVNLLPLISFGIGLFVGALATPFTEMDLVLRLWAGGFAGLSGTGLFELFKHRDGQSKEVN